MILVRHAMPDARPDVPHDRWSLTEEGRAAAARLDLPRGARILASDELKAIQTAEAIGGEIIVDARVRETHRPYEWRDDFRERARAYVSGVQHPGWEAHAEVAARFDAAVQEHAPDIVVTHGQAMTLWLASIGAIEDPAAFWGELMFPHVVRV